MAGDAGNSCIKGVLDLRPQPARAKPAALFVRSDTHFLVPDIDLAVSWLLAAKM
jgi:hypothetical protein